MFASKTYLQLAIIFAIASILTYIGVIAIPVNLADYSQLLDSLYYNGCALYRLFFCLSANYLCIYAARWDRRTKQIIYLKYLLIYLCGFQFVRFVFNMFVGEKIMPSELSFDLFGLILVVYLCFKSLRNDDRY